MIYKRCLLIQINCLRGVVDLWPKACVSGFNFYIRKNILFLARSKAYYCKILKLPPANIINVNIYEEGYYILII